MAPRSPLTGTEAEREIAEGGPSARLESEEFGLPSAHPTVSGMTNQPDSDEIFSYPSATKFGEGENAVGSKEVLWGSVSALMRKHYGKENLTQLAKDCKIGPATASRVKEQKTSVGVEVIDRIAARFGLHAWQLLVPGFDPAHIPTLQPLSEREAALYERFKAVLKEAVDDR